PEVAGGKAGGTFYLGNLIDGIWPAHGRFVVALRNVTVVLDHHTGRVVAHRNWDSSRSPVGFGDGIQVSLCRQASLCGDDPGTGPAMWHRGIPGTSWSPDFRGGVRAAGDRVYTVFRTNDAGDRRVAAFDIRTGRVLGLMALGKDPPVEFIE